MPNRSSIEIDQTLNAALEQTISEYPDREALVVGSARLTYRELGRQVDALAAGLARLGIGRGDVVGIILPNCPEGFVAYFAVWKIGAIAAQINPRLGPRELQHILSDAGAVAVITIAQVLGRKYSPLIEGLRPNLPKLRHLIVKGGESGDGDISLESVMQGEPQALPKVQVDPKEVCCLIYTSGTTGLPKGAMHSHRSALANDNALLQLRGYPEFEALLAPFPLFHIAGIVVLLPFFVGGKIVVLEQFDPRLALKAIEAERVTLFAGVPVMYQAMLQLPNFKEYDISSLRVVGGGAAPFSPELIRAITTNFAQGNFWQAYGLTEGGFVSFSPPDEPEEKHLKTVGRPSAVNAQLKIVDDERREVPVGQVGEVACRAVGPMLGYYNHPQETAQAIDAEGWLYTGDVGYLDHDGYLSLVDRKKDMIKRGAEGISSGEIEGYLMTNPKIQNTAVIGLPSRTGGEKIRAYVQPREGIALTEKDVLDYCRGQIAPHKIPDEVRIVSSLPLTATLKVQKFILREEAKKEQAV